MPSISSDYDPSCMPDLLPIYYKRLFPYGPYYRWLNYGGVPKTYFGNREFSFTLKDDVYIRYQSFTSQQEMEDAIRKACPYKIDLGAVYSHQPKDHKMVKAAAFQAVEKELVFDIDMTDYDDVRSCCSGADICNKCWPLMTIAIRIINRALKEDFGFQHCLWVYSGRRGVHCWVCDEAARKLSSTARTAVAEYLNIVKGGESQVRKVNLPDKLHPSLQKAAEIINDMFEEYAIKEQDFLGDNDQIQKVLALIPDEDFRKECEKYLTECKTSKLRWDILKYSIKTNRDQNKYKKSWKIIEEIMFQYCYPRLDIKVSTGINHLLKSPFCVHPKTGRVCVPIDVEDVKNFDPFSVPTIVQLCDELNAELSDSDAKKIRDYKQTSLKSYMQIFDIFLKQLENSNKVKRLQQIDMKQEF